jgi:hypothetical protein
MEQGLREKDTVGNAARRLGPIFVGAGVPSLRFARCKGERLDSTEVDPNVVLVWGALYVGLAALQTRCWHSKEPSQVACVILPGAHRIR